MSIKAADYLSNKFGDSADLVFLFADALEKDIISLDELEKVAEDIKVENTTQVPPQVTNILNELSYAYMEGRKAHPDENAQAQNQQAQDLLSSLSGLFGGGKGAEGLGALGGLGGLGGGLGAGLGAGAANPMETLQAVPKLLSVSKAMHTPEGHEAFYNLYTQKQS